MPSIFQLEGPRLDAPLAAVPAKLPWFLLGVITLGAVSAAVVLGRHVRGRLGSPRSIASEAKNPEEYARRVEAWSASEAKPPSVAVMAKAYGKNPRKVEKLIREARETRIEGRERLWSRMSRGLRGLNGYRVWYGTSDGKKTFRVVDERKLETIEQATKLMRSYKRQGLWTWVEDDDGNFVPVPGAKSERARKSYPLRGARGFDGPVPPTRSTTSEPGYLYHATNTERAYDIVKAGVRTHGPSYGTDQDTWPDGSTEKRSYWSRKAEVVHSFAPEEGKPVIIRVKESEVKAGTERYTGDVFIRTKVAPQKIEILTDDGWQPLNERSLAE